MPFHPIALHFHIAMFMVNIAAVMVLAIMRLKVTPNLIDEERTRGQRIFQSLDWVVIITTFVGVITTVIGILTGFGELITPPHIAEFTYDMYMWIKIYMSFMFLVLYTLPLLFRVKYGPMMWKSKGMSAIYILYIIIGFYLVVVTTFLGSYDTSYIIYNGHPVELSQQFLELISPTFIFVIFGAIPGNICENYLPGEFIPFSMTTFLITTLMILSICLFAFFIFYSLRTRQLKSYAAKFDLFVERLRKEKINTSNVELQYLLREMAALKINVKLDQTK